MKLNKEQEEALKTLAGPDNVFLTGSAGTGKSFVIKQFLKTAADYPILASTGAAAVLLGGRTFHSFFGLGIMEGGAQKTIERASKTAKVIERVKNAKGVIIDEISMIGGATLHVAEAIARKIRKNTNPWGGLKIIAVGDFHQLPPINRDMQTKDWAFLNPVWRRTEFVPVILHAIERAKDDGFVAILNLIREGRVNEDVMRFMKLRSDLSRLDDECTRLFPKRDQTDKYNMDQLALIESKQRSFKTKYTGTEKGIAELKKNAPVGEEILLKEGALVMIRMNDPEGGYVNGSTGILEEISNDGLSVRLTSGRVVEIETTTFDLLNADGEAVASAANFPISLAYATTIHKAQGMTLDKMVVNLRNLWEPGHAYVALSRVRRGEDLFIEDWSKDSIFTDADVNEFYGSFVHSVPGF